MSRIRQLGRTMLSFLPKVGLVSPPAHYRPEGISAMMTVKDEEDWIERSVLSIADIVNEIVVVDNGSEDGTFQILERLQGTLKAKLRLFSFPREDFCAAVNHTMAQTSYRWILRWHGDFVGRTSGPLAISRLVDRTQRLDVKRYYCIWLGPVSLDGDLFHQIPQREVELEPFFFTYGPGLVYAQIGRFETLQVPWFYKRIEWRDLYFFHMRNVKPARRILYRFFWTEWMSLPDKSRFPTLDTYVRYRIREVYGTSDIKEAMRKRMRDLGRDLVKYDKQRFGNYPEIIGPDLRHPKYVLLYRGNEIVSRNDIEIMEHADSLESSS